LLFMLILTLFQIQIMLWNKLWLVILNLTVFFILMLFCSTLLYILLGHCIQDYLVYPTLVCICCKTHQVLAGRQRRSCVVWHVVGNWKWEGFLHAEKLLTWR
jgi:hypothetical protein